MMRASASHATGRSPRWKRASRATTARIRRSARRSRSTRSITCPARIACETMIQRLDYAAWRKEQAARRGSTRPIGIGVSAYVEGTGLGPFEGADVRVDPATGKVFVYLGVCQQGQGHETVFAQICAEHF